MKQKFSVQNKIKVAFVFHKDNYFLLGKHFDNTYYNFFIKALKRNDRISVKDYKTDEIFDCSKLKNEARHHTSLGKFIFWNA